jgi:hypothetical protein
MQRAGWIDVFYIVGSRKQVKGTFFSIGRREHIDNIIITPTTIFVIGVIIIMTLVLLLTLLFLFL